MKKHALWTLAFLSFYVAIASAETQINTQFELVHTDNLYYEDESTVSSWMLKIHPTLEWEQETGELQYQTALNVDYTQVIDSSIDNLLDYNLMGGVGYSITEKQYLGVKASTQRKDDPRGTSFSKGKAMEQISPDSKYNQSFLIEYQIGQSESIGQIKLASQYATIHYGSQLLNSGSTIIETERRAFSSTENKAQFIYRYSDKTQIITSIHHEAINYNLASEKLARNATELKLQVGVRWEPSQSIALNALLGQINKDFDSSEKSTSSATSWLLDFTWKPKEHSVLQFFSETDLNETNAVGDYIEQDRSVFEWSHQWSNDWQTELSANYVKERYKPSERVDSTSSFGLAAQKTLMNESILKVGFLTFDRSTTAVEADFDFNRKEVFFSWSRAW